MRVGGHRGWTGATRRVRNARAARACRSVNLRCWKMARVASAEGGAQVARDFLRQRSLSEARMLTTTVRLSGCAALVVLKSLAAA